MKMAYEKRKSMYGYGFIALWFVGALIFFLIPVVESLLYSFQEIAPDTGGMVGKWVGLDNYNYAFNVDPNYRQYLVKVLEETAWKTPLILVFSLFVAVILNQKFRGRTFSRAVFFLPVIIATGPVYNIINGNLQSTGNSDVENRVYTLYISGSDTRQGLNTVGRSDVNILATINTETRQILLVTTPRDYYVPLPVSGGIPDKLTHAGIYGVNVSIGTLEMLYDTDIDYYFRLNFSGFTGIVDALGGITVDNDVAFTKGNYTYPVGKVQMDGKMALTFARERYSFVDGDIQRGKNQLKVISAIIDKALSPDILVRYNSIMDSIKDCFEMDVPYDDIAALVRHQLSDNGSWNVVQCSVTGTGDSQIPYSMSDYAYVMRPDYNTVNKAKELMQAVKDGKTLSKTDTNITDADRTRYASMPGDPAASYTSSGSGTQSSSSNNYSYSDSNDYSYSGGSDNSGYEEPSVPSEPSGGETPSEPAGGDETPSEPSGGEEIPSEPSGDEETPAEPDPGTNGGETIAEPAA